MTRRSLFGLVAAGVGVASLSAWGASRPAATARSAVETPRPEGREVLREAAREVLDRNCGECHTGTLPTALPRALAVYDLAKPEWSRRASDAQLREAERRLHETFAPTLGEGEARPVRVSAEELDRFHRFVALETGRRAER